ncbi:hypothetical protein ACF07Y_38995 [Streptomyces sp. NPDC016566]|uniref:hypothetical protein n=1 Tax=Streptomyces sp. NPDC016566 TaxID=3364967 RepID=UPI0036FC5134
MPPPVARLPRNSAGRPVPGNITWYEPDDNGATLVTRDSEKGAHITCPCTPGSGTPRFGEQCPVRQRQFMTQRQCGLCTQGIRPTDQLVFIGETNAQYYLEPPLHPLCAAYALQVCPVLHASGERIEVALTHSYTLAEDRITGVSADGTMRRSVFAFGDPVAHHLAVLEFYLAFPDTPERRTGPKWLGQRAPRLLP